MAHESATILRLCYILCRSVLDSGDVTVSTTMVVAPDGTGDCGAAVVGITGACRFCGSCWIHYDYPVGSSGGLLFTSHRFIYMQAKRCSCVMRKQVLALQSIRGTISTETLETIVNYTTDHDRGRR
jgi:hypothetical protein